MKGMAENHSLPSAINNNAMIKLSVWKSALVLLCDPPPLPPFLLEGMQKLMSRKYFPYCVTNLMMPKESAHGYKTE